MPPPTLKTERLLLRPFALDDAADVQRMACDKAIAENTLAIPHPYPDGAAEEWIETHENAYETDVAFHYAIVLTETDELIGAISLMGVSRNHHCAEMGYWIGRLHWNRGYCTEACQAVLDYGFNTLALNRIHAHHFGRNPASGRVMQKIGMTLEGCLRQHIQKWEHWEDMVVYGILRPEYHAKSPHESYCSGD